jgi:UDP-N-acetylmuramate--alanine ligase
MHIYFSGIGGIGLSALAHMALDAGYSVSGSDLDIGSSVVTDLQARGAKISDDQSNDFVAQRHHRQPIDWLVHSAAIPADNDERTFATAQKIKQTKRGDFIHHLLDKFNLQLLAISGTHGKTTSTAMAVWALKQQMPISWLIGSEISFGRHGSIDPKSQWLVMELDEYDRLMLEFSPKISLIPSIDYDHPDIYPTKGDYDTAFRQFVDQSDISVGWLADAQQLELSDSTSFHALSTPQLTYDELPLMGEDNRANAELVACGLQLADVMPAEQVLNRLISFPGTARRFERIKQNLITDYAHHPTAIASTVELAKEYKVKQNANKLIVVYQPHQDERQRDVKSGYKHCFDDVDRIYWLPTYDPPGRHSRPSLPPGELIANLSNSDVAELVDMNAELLKKIDSHLEDGDLVVVMGAGSVDNFVRSHFLAESS